MEEPSRSSVEKEIKKWENHSATIVTFSGFVPSVVVVAVVGQRLERFSSENELFFRVAGRAVRDDGDPDDGHDCYVLACVIIKLCRVCSRDDVVDDGTERRTSAAIRIVCVSLFSGTGSLLREPR